MFTIGLVSFENGMDPLFRIVGILLIFFFVFFWLAIVIWTINDVLNRSKSLVFQCFSVVMVMAFNLLGLIVYIIFRPAKTLEEENFDNLEKRVLETSVGSQSTCPGCKKTLDASFLSCPYCQAVVRKACSHCKNVLEKDWKFCPYCKTKVVKPKNTKK